MNEKTSTNSKVSKKLSKRQAITVMVVGGLMLLLSLIVPTGENSTAYTIKVIVGLLGVVIVFAGAYFRP